MGQWVPRMLLCHISSGQMTLWGKTTPADSGLLDAFASCQPVDTQDGIAVLFRLTWEIRPSVWILSNCIGIGNGNSLYSLYPFISHLLRLTWCFFSAFWSLDWKSPGHSRGRVARLCGEASSECVLGGHSRPRSEWGVMGGSSERHLFRNCRDQWLPSSPTCSKQKSPPTHCHPSMRWGQLVPRHDVKDRFVGVLHRPAHVPQLPDPKILATHQLLFLTAKEAKKKKKNKKKYILSLATQLLENNHKASNHRWASTKTGVNSSSGGWSSGTFKALRLARAPEATRPPGPW